MSLDKAIEHNKNIASHIAALKLLIKPAVIMEVVHGVKRIANINTSVEKK